MTENLTETEINQVKKIIISAIRKRDVEKTEILVNLIKKELNMPEEQIMHILQVLEDEKVLEFHDSVFPESGHGFLFSTKALWYWLFVLMSVSLIFIIMLSPESSTLVVYLRNILGLAFVTYLPGYAIIKFLYPINVPLKTQSLTLDIIERVALSLGLSIAVTSILGLLLYYTPLGIKLLPIALSLLGVTIFFASAAIWREYRSRKSIFVKKYRKNIAYFNS